MGKFEAAVKKGGKEFMRNDHLGYIVTRPEKLGTALKAGVSLSIPKLAAHPKVKEVGVCSAYYMVVFIICSVLYSYYIVLYCIAII